MKTIPTELLRTLVAVVDLRSFTNAARSLGITQPAVSAQIKRLQKLLGCEVLDKAAPGVRLTPRGEVIIQHARRMLAINDDILQSLEGGPSGPTLRVGMPSDFYGSRVPASLARFRLRWPEVRYVVTSGPSESLLGQLQRGEVDIVMAVTKSKPAIEPRHWWMREAVWVSSNATRIDPNDPVPMVCYADDCAYQQVAVAALRRAGRDFKFIFTSWSLVSLVAAVAAGFGVMAMPIGRARKSNLSILEHGVLPRLPDLFTGVYVRDGGNRTAVLELADCIADGIRPNDDTILPSSGATIAPLRA
jgi:DNA-binding transcriptional LysR family regulator